MNNVRPKMKMSDPNSKCSDICPDTFVSLFLTLPYMFMKDDDCATIGVLVI